MKSPLSQKGLSTGLKSFIIRRQGNKEKPVRKERRYSPQYKCESRVYSYTAMACIGGSAVAMGFHLLLAGADSPYTQSSSLTSSSCPSQSSTYTPTPASKGSRRTSKLDRRSCVCSLRSAAIKSSASGVALGGSSLTCSQPTGGDPGGDIRKFFSTAGG